MSSDRRVERDVPGRFGNLQHWQDDENQPAAPAGMQQAAGQAQGFESGDNRFANSSIGRMTAQQGYTAQAQSWYTGANREGQANGWSNGFTQKFIDGQNKAADEGDLNSYFDRPDATGVVTWDHDNTAGTKSFKFGDVYEDGKFQGNIYDQFKDQPGTADLMMSDWLFDAKTKSKLFADATPNPDGTVSNRQLEQAIQDKREQNNREIPQAMQAREFQSKVDERTKEFEEGHVDEATTLGAGLATGGIGAGIGSFAGPIGTAAGFGIGFVGGGLAAYLNKDSLAQQAARAYEITAMSSRENGGLAGVMTGVQQWSGFSGKLISPLSNTVQGLADTGHRGDGQSEFYKVNAEGESVVPKWVKAADVVGSVGDSLLQFSNPVGLTLYTTQMSGNIAGEVGELTVTGGKSFDYSRGGFDNIFTDDNGDFDPLRGAAGIGKVAIDAVQLGIARGLAGKADAAMVGAGEKAAYSKVRIAVDRLPKFLGGTPKGSTEIGEAAGFKFFKDEAGNVTKRATLSLLAPSEQLGAISARVMGMRAAAQKAGAYSTDDFYRAALSYASGERKIATALVNGMGEGYEEAVQQVLEPYSHQQSISMSDIANSALYGFAAGVGMGLGTNINSPTSDQKLLGLAQMNRRTQGLPDFTREEWAALTDVEKRTVSAMSGLNRETAMAAYQKIASDQATEVNAGVVGANKLVDAIRSKLDTELAKATRRTDGAFQITGMEDAGRVDKQGRLVGNSLASDAVGSSAFQLAANIHQHRQGLEIQRDKITRDLQNLTAQAAAAPDNADLPLQIANYQATLQQLELTQGMGRVLDEHMDPIIERMYSPDATIESIQADAAQLNDLLSRAFNMRDMPEISADLTNDEKVALAKSVSLVFGRDPWDNSGSIPILLPQASAALTAQNADNVLQVSQAILPAISGDFDGDKIRQQAQLVFDNTAFTNARAGMAFLGAGTSVNVGEPKYERYVVEQMSRALSGSNTALRAYASGTLIDIATAIRGRYRDIISDDVLDEVFKDFFEKVESNSKSARNALLDGLAEKAGTQITELARGTLSNEWLWIDQLVRAHVQTFQETYAAHRPNVGVPNTDVVAINRQSDAVRQRQMERAATEGQTYGLWLAGDSQFRGSQKLHYTSLTAAVLSAEQGGSRADLEQLALAYEALGSGLTRSEIAAVRGKDDITARVYAQLKRLSTESAADVSRALGYEVSDTQALSVIANVKVLDLRLNDQGFWENKGEITLAQLLLRRSVEQDQRDKAAILELSPELQAKHARLLSYTRPPRQGVAGSRPVNAQRAFVEVVGAQQLFALLGDDAEVFGPQLTVEQFIRYYSSLSEKDRRETDRKLEGEAAYLGRPGTTNIPYGLDEVMRGEVSSYRAVVDSIIAVGHHRITISDKGTLSGDLADRSDLTGKSFRSAHDKIRRAMREFAGLSPKDNELSVEQVARMMNNNPDFARSLLALIPNANASATFEVRNGEVYIANWVYELFTLSSAEEAEMSFLRNTILSGWNAKGMPQKTSEVAEGQVAREFGRLDSRFHRIMWNLAQQPDGILLNQFVQQMEQATSVEQFVKWVNTTPGIRGNQAPLTAWVDDTAEFDADKAKGGWTTALTGAELREAVGQLQVASQNLLTDLAQERAAAKSDADVIASIERHLSGKGDGSDRDLHDRFQKAIDLAAEYREGVGPYTMLAQAVGAARGFNAQMHTKGKNPPNVAPLGAFDALKDAFDYTTNYERMLASLTTLNLDAVGGSMGQIAKDSIRTMDDHGRVVEWEKPDVKSMLELFKNNDTRPMARAVLFPKVHERGADGRLSQQLIVGKELRSLLNGVSHKELFPKSDKLSQDSAFRYLAYVEAQARKGDGVYAHFGVQRVVNDLVIARTSAADHLLTTYELENMVTQAMRDVAQVLQSAGSIAADPSVKAGTDPLAEVLDLVSKAQRQVKTRDMLGVRDQQDDVMRTFDQLVELRRQDIKAEMSEIARRPQPTEGDKARVRAELLAAQADLQRFETKVELLQSDDMAAQVVQMFEITEDNIDDGAKKQAVVQYILDNLSLFEAATSQTLVLGKLGPQLLDSGRGGQVELTDSEWMELSRQVVGYYLEHLVSSTAPGVSVAPYPDQTTEMGQAQARYYDPSFAYLVAPLLDSSNPLVQAARDLHLRAERHGIADTSNELIHLLDTTIFKEFSLGRWTGDIPRASIEAQQRIDSAGAEAGIAIPGNSAKRQAVISAATKRTYLVPPDELLSEVPLTWIDLNSGSDFDEVDVLTPQGARSTPLVMLNNRFAKGVTMTYADDEGTMQEVDLLTAWPNLGRPFVGNDNAAGSGLQEVSLQRIQQAVDHITSQRGVDPARVAVKLSFFHPETQPSGPEWFNNLYFEGTNFTLDADSYQSLNAGFWFAASGLNQTGQRQALDASKLGKPALQTIETASAADRKTLDDGALSDLAATLRAKAQLVFEKDLGFGVLSTEVYNSVLKDLKLRHFVRGQDEAGQSVLWSAEQVIAFQREHPGEPLPMELPTLWIPSDDVLRSMLGEQGNQGVPRVFDTQLEVDLARVPAYRGVTDTMTARFIDGIGGATSRLEDTRIGQRARQNVLSVRTSLPDEVRNTFDQRIRFLRALESEAATDRAEFLRTERGAFDPARNLQNTLYAAVDALSSENISLDYTAAGAPFIGPRNLGDARMADLLLHELAAALDTESAHRTGWIYEEEGHSAPPAGQITNVDLGGKHRPGLQIAPGDIVLVKIDSFNGDLELAKKRLAYIADRGATIAMVADNSMTDLRAPLGEYLDSINYGRIIGSSYAYQPQLNRRYANQRARLSTLTEVRGVSQRSHLAVLHVPNKPVEENAAVLVNPTGERTASVAEVLNLIPTDFMAGFNVPVQTSQVDKVKAHLRGYDTESGRRMLRQMSAKPNWSQEERDTHDAAWDGAWQRLMDRIDQNPGTVLPEVGDEFGKGDFIPLVDNTGRVLLYRHGYKAPTRQRMEEQIATVREGSMDAAKVAVFSGDIEQTAKTNSGIVTAINPRAGYGLSVQLSVPLQAYGDKQVLEWNGMKYVLTPRSADEYQLPDHGFFANGWGIDLIASQHDMVSKEAFDGLINNHRNAFAYFGTDFTGDLTRFFGTADGRETRELLEAFSRQAPRITVEAADELLNAERLALTFREKLVDFATSQENLATPSWTDALADPTSVETQIAAAVLVYLSTPGARVEDVLTSGGFNDSSTSLDAQSRLMPRLFTQVFDNAPLNSALRKEMNLRFNQQLHNPNNDGSGYSLSQTWDFTVHNQDRSKDLVGQLMFAEAHSSGDNPVLNGQAFDETQSAAVSQHTSSIAFQATGAETAYTQDIAIARIFAEGSHVERFERDVVDGGVWRMLTNVNKDDRSQTSRWKTDTPAEAERRNLAREAVTQYRQPINTEDAHGWSNKQRKDYDDLRNSIMNTLGLLDSQSQLVDFWVRQILGMPYGEGHTYDAQGKVTGTEQMGFVSGKAAIEAAKDIAWNVEHRYLPIVGAEAPLLHINDLQLIYRSNRKRGNGWAPRESMEPTSAPVKDWDGWVTTSLGGMILSDDLFDPMYLLAVDGLMHGYSSATRSLLDLPVSADSVKALQLLDPDFNIHMLSINEQTQRALGATLLVDTQRASLEEMLGGRRIAGRLEGKAAPASEVAKRREARRKWRAENGVPIPVDVTMKNFRKNGARFVDNSTTTNAFARSLINLRVGTALINPALYVSMGPEQWFRGVLDRASNLLTGQSTTGLLARQTAKLSQDETSLLGRMGWTPRFNEQQLIELGRLYDTLGERSDFKSMVYRDLMFLRPHAEGIGRIEKMLEGYARFGSRIQDPTWGMRSKTLARRYVEAALQHILANPAGSTITPERLISELATDPQFLQKNLPEAHQAATNSIAQLRSLKATPLSLALRGIYEPMSESSNSATNFLGNVVLKMPLLFSGYAANVATTITGMQGASDVLAAILHGRSKGPNGIFGRLQSKLRGDEFDPSTDAKIDMGSVLEGIDLTRSFIRGGLTHTALFSMGLMAGGLGLTGEDDETKKRRRAAKLQGAGFVYDPRAIENDFRNADSVFLDWLPFGLDTYFNVGQDANGHMRSMGQLHWMMKQFISPIIGMERFYETGDFRQVGWGFEDALGSFPLINTLMWNDAVETASEMASMADDQAALGGPHNMIAASNLLTTAVGTYERMLFENSFVNMLYTSMDRYDRDPYKLPLIDSDGDLQQQMSPSGEQTRPNDTAMENYTVDENGNTVVKQGYLTRDDTSAKLHSLTENRATLAFAMSMFTGLGDSDYFRRNMPIKTREIEKPPMSKEDAEAVIRAISGSLGGQRNLTAEELSALWKGQAKEAGVYVDWSELDKQAAAAEAIGAAGTGYAAPLSVLDKNGKEVLTKDGMRAIYQGLAKGSVKLGDASLAGVYIPFEMREEIQTEWMHELIQEGVNMGLDQTKATSRMRRLWYGPTADPTVQGLGDILWSKDISYSDTITYNQLNTTYVMGPDGRPWATGFTRDGVLGALGLKPVKRAYVSESGATGTDQRLNTTDLVNNLNTGLRALELVDESVNIPTDAEIGKSIEDAIKKAAQDQYTPFGSTSGSGGGGGYYGRRGGYGGGGYGGYSSSGYANFDKMYALPGGRVVYGKDIPFINTSNPIIRRADVRRERISSDRGRLKQWQ